MTIQDSLAPVEAEDADEQVTAVSLGVWAGSASAPACSVGLMRRAQKEPAPHPQTL